MEGDQFIQQMNDFARETEHIHEEFNRKFRQDILAEEQRLCDQQRTQKATRSLRNVLVRTTIVVGAVGLACWVGSRFINR